MGNLSRYDRRQVHGTFQNNRVSELFIAMYNVVDVFDTTEVEFINGVTAGIAAASKALVLGTSKEIATIGAITASETLLVTITGPTAPDDAVKGVALLTVGYSAGSVNAVKGVCTCSAVNGQTVRNMSAGWFGLEWTSAMKATGGGVSRGVNVEVVNKSTTTAPNGLLYLQSIAGSGASLANMPYIVFTDSGSGTQSNILFELGHAAAAQQITIGTGNLFYENTIQIAVNESSGSRTAWYIPLSSAEASYTSAFPVSLSYAGGNALLVTTTSATTGLTDIQLTSTFTGTTQWQSHVGLNATVTYTPAAGTGSCWIEAIGGKVIVNGTIDAQTYYKAIGANLTFSASADYDAASSIACAITASINTDSSATIQDGNIAILHLNCASANTALTNTAGICTFVFLDNDGGHATGGMDSVFHLHTWDTPYLFNIPSGGYTQGIQDTGTQEGEECVGHLKCLFNGSTAYINLYSDNS